MHYYEKNIVEIKNEYTRFLVNIMCPYIYEGFQSMYQEAKKSELAHIEKEKITSKVKNPGVLKIFQSILRDVQDLNNNFIDEETRRIKERAKCSEFFDDLVRAVVKSNIILLTFNASGKKCKLVKEKLHESIDIRTFVHKCYIESAKKIFNNPELFWHKYPTIETKKCQKDAINLIGGGITEAVRKMLPVRLILQEYLSKDYLESEKQSSENIKEDKYTQIKNQVRRDLFGKGFNAIKDTSSESVESSESEESLASNKTKNNSENKNTANSILESSDSESSEEESEENNVKKLDYDNLVLANHEKENHIVSHKSEPKSEQKIDKQVENKTEKQEIKIQEDNKISEMKPISDKKEPKMVTMGDKKMIEFAKKYIGNTNVPNIEKNTL